MVKPVFKDEKLQKEFDEMGYVTIPFLSNEEVEHLKKSYFDTLDERAGSYMSEETDFQSKSEITYDFTFIDKNWKYKQLVFDTITESFGKHYENVLDNYTPIIANFIRKEEDGGIVPLHQNWAFTDEKKYTSVSIWVPLVDSNVKNGTLQMVDGSHKRFGRYRGPLVPWELKNIKDKIIGDMLTPMNVKAGTAVILDDSIVHYSHLNETDSLRLTVQLICVPAEAPLIHYHLDRNANENEIIVLEVNRNFFMKFHPWLKPSGKTIGKVKFKNEYLDYNQFQKKMKQPKFDKERGVLKILKSIFN